MRIVYASGNPKPNLGERTWVDVGPPSPPPLQMTPTMKAPLFVPKIMPALDLDVMWQIANLHHWQLALLFLDQGK